MDNTKTARWACGVALCAILSACGGEVRVEGSGSAAVEADCSDCDETVLVTLAGLDWLDSEDPGLDIDVCVGLTCGQALVEVVPMPEGTYPDVCIAKDGEVACCFSSPPQAMPACSAEPGGAVRARVALPLSSAAGTSLPVHATVHTMLGEWLLSLDGTVTLVSCGPSCVSGAVVLD